MLSPEQALPFKVSGDYIARYIHPGYKSLILKGINLGSSPPGYFPGEIAYHMGMILSANSDDSSAADYFKKASLDVNFPEYQEKAKAALIPARPPPMTTT